MIFQQQEKNIAGAFYSDDVIKCFPIENLFFSFSCKFNGTRFFIRIGTNSMKDGWRIVK